MYLFLHLLLLIRLMPLFLGLIHQECNNGTKCTSSVGHVVRMSDDWSSCSVVFNEYEAAVCLVKICVRAHRYSTWAVRKD